MISQLNHYKNCNFSENGNELLKMLLYFCSGKKPDRCYLISKLTAMKLLQRERSHIDDVIDMHEGSLIFSTELVSNINGSFVSVRPNHPVIV